MDYFKIHMLKPQPQLTIFGDRAFKEITKLNEIIRSPNSLQEEEKTAGISVHREKST